jgi:hypothetical protein
MKVKSKKNPNDIQASPGRPSSSSLLSYILCSSAPALSCTYNHSQEFLAEIPSRIRVSDDLLLRKQQRGDEEQKGLKISPGKCPWF